MYSKERWLTSDHGGLQATNTASIVDKYPLPDIDDRIEPLGAGKLYATLDFPYGLFQYAIDPDSVHFTAYITPQGLYYWKRMLQGHAGTRFPL